MKRNILMILAAVLVVTVAAIQTRDIASSVDGVVTDYLIFVGTADTSAAVSLDGRVGAALIAATGVVDNVAAPGRVVLQDSGSISSWTARDSITVDSVNTKYYDLHYRRTQPNAKLRTIVRGGASTDTVNIALTILRSCQRAPC